MARAVLYWKRSYWDGQKVTSFDWQTYHSLTLGFPIEQIESVLINRPQERATGSGETTITAIGRRDRKRDFRRDGRASATNSIYSRSHQNRARRAGVKNAIILC